MINVFDIGGRAGIHRSWYNFGLPVNYYCFEPDADEAKRLRQDKDNKVKIIQAAIGGKTGVDYIYTTRGTYRLFSSWINLIHIATKMLF